MTGTWQYCTVPGVHLQHGILCTFVCNLQSHYIPCDSDRLYQLSTRLLCDQPCMLLQAFSCRATCSTRAMTRQHRGLTYFASQTRSPPRWLEQGALHGCGHSPLIALPLCAPRPSAPQSAPQLLSYLPTCLPTQYLGHASIPLTCSVSK